MTRQVRTRPVNTAQVGAYMAKAEEYLAASIEELEAARPIAATSLAIHAAINAADVVTGQRIGCRAAGARPQPGANRSYGRRARTAQRSKRTSPGSCRSRPGPSTSPTLSRCPMRDGQSSAPLAVWRRRDWWRHRHELSDLRPQSSRHRHLHDDGPPARQPDTAWSPTPRTGGSGMVSTVLVFSAISRTRFKRDRSRPLHGSAPARPAPTQRHRLVGVGRVRSPRCGIRGPGPGRGVCRR